MIVVVIVAALIIGFGIYGYNKREGIYEECAEYFGPVKACAFIILTISGFWAAASGIASLFISSINPEPTNIFVGLACLAIGILLAVFTQKKASVNGEGSIIWPMTVAGFGTFWKIEWTIFKFIFFFWLFSNIFGRNDDDE